LDPEQGPYIDIPKNVSGGCISVLTEVLHLKYMDGIYAKEPYGEILRKLFGISDDFWAKCGVMEIIGNSFGYKVSTENYVYKDGAPIDVSPRFKWPDCLSNSTIIYNQGDLLNMQLGPIFGVDPDMVSSYVEATMTSNSFEKPIPVAAVLFKDTNRGGYALIIAKTHDLSIDLGGEKKEPYVRIEGSINLLLPVLGKKSVIRCGTYYKKPLKLGLTFTVSKIANINGEELDHASYGNVVKLLSDMSESSIQEKLNSGTDHIELHIDQNLK
jgi:hypothetical protein